MAVALFGEDVKCLLSTRAFDDRCGARSVAGRMTALSRTPNARGHGCQARHYALRTGEPIYKLAV